MRSAFFVLVVVTFFPFVEAQDPAAEARKQMMRRINGGGSSVNPTTTRTQTVVSYVTYLSKEREWTDAKGRTMMGRLVAFSAPKPGDKGQIVVIQNEKVRLRRAGANADSELAISTLSTDDQTFVKGIDAAVKAAAKTESEKERE